MHYRVRVIVEALKGNDHSETILGNVEADSVEDVAKIVSKFSLGRTETAIEQHERLVAKQNDNASPRKEPRKETKDAKPDPN